VALALIGPQQVTLQAPALPGSYLLIGNGDGQDAGHPFAGHCACMVHNPGYDFNDRNLVRGAAYWALLAQRFLN